MKRLIVEPNRYFDSVFLMRIGTELERLDGIEHAVVAMGTPANLENLAAVGFALDEAASPIRPADLVIAVDGVSEGAIGAARERLEVLLAGSIEAGPGVAEMRPGSLREAIALDPGSNLALISVPGAYAAREARRALRAGLHVMLFSDNVSVADEIALKDEAIERGLLMMGPDCGTAILNGAPLGFANACRVGRIGIVGASGTGIQEISCAVHRLGGGVSQAIGTGGRDLSSDVDARMTRFGIEALARDPRTDVIVVVSKTPAPAVADRVIAALSEAEKPGVVHFVGEGGKPAMGDVAFAATLADAGRLACAAGGLEISAADSSTGVLAKAETDRAPAGRLVGLFTGGTLCQEAWALITRAGLAVHSNVAADPQWRVQPDADVAGHVLWDLGDDAFTVGRPHPMIEPALRDDRVAEAGDDPTVRVILVDCVLGYGAHADPAGSLAAGARRATAAKSGRDLTIVASVTGTDLDPQNAATQRRVLADAGIVVAQSNADAAHVAISALRKGGRS